MARKEEMSKQKNYYENKYDNWVSIVRMRVNDSKKRAKKKNLDFDLDADYVLKLLIQSNFTCPYLSVPFEKKESDYVISIDRIDSSQGYVKGNIEITSRLANTMKNKATQDQLITFAKNILSKKKSYVEETLSATEVCEKFNLNRIYLSRSKIPYSPVSGGKKLYLKSEVEFHLIKKEANDYQIQKYGRAYYPN